MDVVCFAKRKLFRFVHVVRFIVFYRKQHRERRVFVCLDVFLFIFGGAASNIGKV